MLRTRTGGGATRRNLLALALLATTASSCGLVEVSNLREAQRDFSQLAAEERTVTGTTIFGKPTGDSAERTTYADLGKVQSRYSSQQATDLHRRYHELHQRLVKLEMDGAGPLANDQLYGVTATLRVLALWRATFFAHLTRALPAAPTSVEAPGEDDVAAPDGLPVDPKTMNEVVAEANAVAELGAGDKIELFPRDAFLLKAMGALARYDIAYLTALEYAKRGEIATVPPEAATDKVRYLVDQMAKAEEELSKKYSDAKTPQVGSWVVLTRIVMLCSATDLAFKDFSALDEDDPAEAYARLKKRIDQFRTEATDPTSEVHAVLRDLGVTNRQQFVDMTVGRVGKTDDS